MRPRGAPHLIAAPLFAVWLLAGCLGGGTDHGSQPRTEGPLVVAPGEPVLFEAPPADQVSWRFGDGAKSNASVVEHVFADPGLYRVSLEIVVGGDRMVQDRIVAVGAPSTQSLVIESAPSPVGNILSVNAGGQVAWDLGGTVARGDHIVHAFAASALQNATAYALEDGTVHVGSRQVTPSVAAARFEVSDVGDHGAEPTVGQTSSECTFVTSGFRVLRSCDRGGSWDDLPHALSAPPPEAVGDPYLWVDATTDRIFHLELLPAVVGGKCVWVSWSDDDGDNWVANPFDCGTPYADHEKLATGPWTDTALAMNPTYENAVYLCYNKLAGAWCYTSLDGGATFSFGRQVASADNLNQAVDLPVSVGGLHGPVVTAPDGTVLLGMANTTPLVVRSTDNGITWETVAFEADVGVPEEVDAPHIAVDSENNAFYAHVGADHRLYAYRSRDAGATWEAGPELVSGPVRSVALPTAVAGEAGRVAFSFLGTQDTDILAGNAPNGTRWHLYVAYSLDALSEDPSYATVRVTTDPVQIGSICIVFCTSDDNAGDLDPQNGTDQPVATENNNLLDFNGMTLAKDGRILVSFADGCTQGCRDDLAALPVDSRDDRTMVAFMVDGPRLTDSMP